MSPYELVESEKVEFPVALLCSVLGVSRSAFYAWAKGSPSQRKVANERLLAEIRAIHVEHQERYGSPRMCVELRERGHKAKPINCPEIPGNSSHRVTVRSHQALVRRSVMRRFHCRSTRQRNHVVRQTLTERRVRVVALGRKNFLSFGNPRAGPNIAGLYSLVGSCCVFRGHSSKRSELTRAVVPR